MEGEDFKFLFRLFAPEGRCNKTKMLLQVHDELDISVVNPLEAAKIKDIMESAVELEGPNKVDYESGPNWGTIK